VDSRQLVRSKPQPQQQQLSCGVTALVYLRGHSRVQGECRGNAWTAQAAIAFVAQNN